MTPKMRIFFLFHMLHRESETVGRVHRSVLASFLIFLFSVKHVTSTFVLTFLQLMSLSLLLETVEQCG